MPAQGTGEVVEARETLKAPTSVMVQEAPEAELGFDPDALKKKYLEERDKRMRNGGIDQYRPARGSLHHYVEDPYVEPGYTRDPVNAEYDVVIVGGGYGAQLVAARLIQQGIDNICLIEKAGDFGGTWQDSPIIAVI